jgi:hypothetical protein
LFYPKAHFKLGTSLAPIAPNVSAEIVIANQTIDVSNDGINVFDPRQYGTGLLAIDGGVLMHGAVKTTYVRLSTA